MDRRQYVRTTLGVAAALLAGCTGEESDPTDAPTGTATSSPPSSRTETGTPSYDGEEDWLPVPEDELRRGAGRDAIPAITYPVFAEDWSGLTLEYHDRRFGEMRRIEPRLDPDDRVVGVSRDGDARAYPLRVLEWHEVVNDDFGGPLLVTYCPLCGSGVVAERTVEGEETIFGVSGLLYQSNLVMYDRATDSLWSQIEAIAIRGPQTGTRMDLVGSTLTTWGSWQRSHPDTVVLLPPPESSTVHGTGQTRDYTITPYDWYADDDRVGLGREDYDDRLHPKTMVVGVEHDGVAVGYPLPEVNAEGGLVEDSVAGLPVVVVATPDDSLVAYDRRIDGEALTFELLDGNRMQAGGSTWDVLTGEALDGPHEGTTLDRANDRSPLFWFSWADLYPDSEIYGREESGLLGL